MEKANEQELTKNIQAGDNVDIWVDIEKAQEDKSGKRFIYGRASDESLDLDNQVVLSSGIQKSLAYFKKFGKINYDHKSKKDPAYFIGEPVEAEIKNKEFFLKGELYKGVKVADSVWDILKAGGRMGFSLQGKVMKTITEFDKALGMDITKASSVIVTDVAVTPHPKNFNTYCKPWGEFAKSLGASEDEPPTDDEIRAEIEKSLTTAEGSGKAMIGESLEKKIHKTTFGEGKKKEDEDNDDEDGSEKDKKKKKLKKEDKEMLENVQKSMVALETGVSELVKAIERYDEEDENEKDTIKNSKIAAKDEDEEKDEKSEIEEKEDEEDAEDEDAAENKKKKKTKKDKEDEADEKEPDEDNQDDDEESDSAPKKKEMKKAFEVTPVLKYIGEQMEESNDLNKSLIDANVKMTKVIKEQGEMIKSLGERINEIEEQPLPHKSVSRAFGKRAAGDGQSDELIKSVSHTQTLNEMIELRKEGKLSGIDVVKNELQI